MTEREHIVMLQAALEEAYRHITQPKKMEKSPDGFTISTYRHTSGEYNRLTTKIRTAMMATS